MSGEFDDDVEGEQIISINEYVYEVEEKELEVDFVLGGDEGKACTYSKRYWRRQQFSLALLEPQKEMLEFAMRAP